MTTQKHELPPTGYRLRRRISPEDAKFAIISDLRRGWLGPDNPYCAAQDYYEVRFQRDGSCDVYELIEIWVNFRRGE